MTRTLLTQYWKQILIVVLLVAIVAGCRAAWISHGQMQYGAGYAQAQADQKEADDLLRAQREQEKTQIEYEALSRIDAARADAAFADATACRLRTELDKVRKLAERHTGTFPSGTPAGQVVGVLADMLEESNAAYRRTAEEAERYREAGTGCEQQYDSLRRASDKFKGP